MLRVSGVWIVRPHLSRCICCTPDYSTILSSLPHPRGGGLRYLARNKGRYKQKLCVVSLKTVEEKLTLSERLLLLRPTKLAFTPARPHSLVHHASVSWIAISQQHLMSQSDFALEVGARLGRCARNYGDLST